MTRKQSPSYPVSIFVAGGAGEARDICRAFCDEEGLCVTVTQTAYVYTGGEETGVIVGLINYPRFPSEPSDILTTAKLLALELMHKLEQESVSVQTPDETYWFSIRAADCDSDGTATAAANGDLPVPKDCQARAESIAQNPSKSVV